ncbi:MAG: ketoacyl-ACP synthase III [Nitrospirales bacterium]|nr:ketoacyl-ACP synthase III [Nitrospira sp.]MDR4501719.1 ketoacyl-ACP synthase III [Nitrospirales bacterium]
MSNASQAHSSPCVTRIAGTGSYLPTRIVSNAQVARLLGVEEGYIYRVSGIRERHWSEPSETCSLLAEQAARQALDQAKLKPSDIDTILLSTTSPEMGGFPSTACLLQRRLGINGASAFDISASCSGFLYGLSQADTLIRSGYSRRCLVVAAEVKSCYLNPDNTGTALLFGDGAGAAVVTQGHDPHVGIQNIRLFSDGQYTDLVSIPAGGSREPMSPSTVQAKRHTLRLKGATLFRVAVKQLAHSLTELLASHQVSVEDLDHVMFHQANGRILAKLAARLHIPVRSVFSVIERTGNTSSASLPLTLDMANRQGRLKPGDLILLGTFGGGITWGGALLRWG